MILFRQLANEAAPAAIAGIVEIQDQSAVDVADENSILIVVGDGEDADPRRELEPLAIAQDMYVEALLLQVVVDARALVIGDEHLLAAQQLN